MEPGDAALDLALTGRHAHPEPLSVLSGLSAEAAAARPEGTSRSICELLGHLVFWQDTTIRWLEGEVLDDLPGPEDAWPEGPEPESPEAWEALVGRFADGLAAARNAAAGNLEAPVPGVPDVTRAGVLQVLAAHNSWHLGQILTVRRTLGLWPAG